MSFLQEAQSSYILEARDLGVALDNRIVLDVPFLQVASNEVLVVIGPNGSGKTTLLLALSLLIKPTAGLLQYRGHPVATDERRQEIRRRNAVVFQEPLLLSASVRDNVSLGLRLRGAPHAEVARRSDLWLERFGIAHLANRRANKLSGGEAKRASLARAFVLNPEVLFLDEPFNGLDSPTRQSLIEDFEGVLRETRVTTIMVTHERNEALALAHRVAVLMEGRIRQIGSPQEVFSMPVDDEVAAFVESGNILSGVVSGQCDGVAAIAVNGGQFEVVTDLAVGTRVTASLPHDAVTLELPSQGASATSARNRFSGIVSRIFPVGSQTRVTVDCGFTVVALVTGRSATEMRLGPGQPLVVSFKASSVHLIPRLGDVAEI